MNKNKDHRRVRARLRACLTGLLCLLAVSGCEALFTTSPLSFLQRDPSKLSDDQKISWAEAAWASGDEEAMADAYAAIADLATGSSDPELTYLAANLALELSGVPGIVDSILADVENIVVDTAFLDTVLSSVDGGYVSAAATFFQDTMTNGPDALTGTDLIMGTLCLIYDAAVAGGDTSIGDLTSADVAPAQTFITDADPLVPDDQDAQDILNEIDNYLATLP
jgi:hypothetical protein